LTRKRFNLCTDLRDHNIDIAAVQETFAGEDMAVYDPRTGAEFDAGYVTLLDNHDTTTEYNSKPRQGVGFIVRRELLDNISKTRRFSARIMSIEGKFRGEDLLIFSVYGPCTGNKYTDDDRLAFVEDMEDAIEKTLSETGDRYRGRIIILGDLNAEVGQIAPQGEDEWGDILGPHLRPERSTAGEYLLEFCDDQRAHGGMTIANSFFPREHSGSYAGRGGKGKSTLDHVLVSRKMWEEGLVADAGVSTSEFFLKTSPKHAKKESDDEAGTNRYGTSIARGRGKLDKGYDHYVTVLTLRIQQQKIDLVEDAATKGPAGDTEGHASGQGTSRSPGKDRRGMPGHRVFTTKAVRQTFDAMIAGPIAALLEDARTKKGEAVYKDVTTLYDELISIVEKAYRGLNNGSAATQPSTEDWLEQNAKTIKVLSDEARSALGCLRGAGKLATNRGALVQDHADKRRAVQHALRQMRNAFYENLAAKLQATHVQNRGQFYKQAKQGLGPRAEQEAEVMEKGILRPPDEEGGKMQTTTTTAEGREVWLEHWVTTLNVAGPPISFASIDSFLSSLKRKRAPVTALDREVTMRELEEALKKCKGDRCCGEDGMNIGLFKGGETSDERKILLIMVNRALSGEDKTPAAWRDVIIQIIYKSGARNLCKNYRPISLISHCGKLVERIIQGRLEELKAGDADLSSETQWAQGGCSTSDAIIISKAVGTLAVKRGCTIHKCFADLKGAFDSVPRALLFEMLEHIGVPARLLALIKSMHEKSMARVRWNDGDLSESFELKCGLKQGAIYSPCLFSIFFNFVTAWMKQECGREGVGVTLSCGVTTRRSRHAPQHIYGAKVRSDEGTITLTTNEFADDLEMDALSTADLQTMVSIFGRACAAFGLVVNYKKTVVMAVEPAQRAASAATGAVEVVEVPGTAAPVTPMPGEATRLQSLRPRTPAPPAAPDSDSEDDEGDDDDDACPPRTPRGAAPAPDAVAPYEDITLDTLILERVTSFCYLGHLLNSRGTMANELAARRSKMRTTFNRLRENVIGNFYVPIRTRLHFFNAAVIEGCMYACETWTLTQGEIDSLESVQYQLLLRTFYGAADIRSGRRSRKSLLDLIEQAAMAGCKVLPIEVQLQVARLRYYGHIVRREVQLRGKGRGPCVHTFLLQHTCRLDGDTGPGAVQAARITFASSTRAILESARTKEMIANGESWLAVAQDAKKKAYSKLVKGEVTEKLMTSWVEARCKAHDGRRALETEKWPEDPDVEDIHDKTCHICEKKGSAKRYMCGQCLKVEHLTCAEWVPEVDGRIEDFGSWVCTDCKVEPFRSRTDRAQPLPGDEQRFRYHSADDIRKQGKNILMQWAKIQGTSDRAKEAEAEHERAKDAKRARWAIGEARSQEMQASLLTWRARSKRARLEERRSAAAGRRERPVDVEKGDAPSSVEGKDARRLLWEDDDNSDEETRRDEVWDAYDPEGAPGEVIALDGTYDFGDDDCDYDGDAGSGEDVAVEAPVTTALILKGSVADDEEDVDEDRDDESLEFEAPPAEVGQRRDRPLLRAGSAAAEEEDVDEALDESSDAEGSAAPAGDKGEEVLGEDDLYADLGKFMRAPDAAEGRECDGDGEHGGSGREFHLTAELEEVQITDGEERRRDVEGAIGREGGGNGKRGEGRHSSDDKAAGSRGREVHADGEGGVKRKKRGGTSTRRKCFGSKAGEK
jgi:hypothetical protein